MPKTTTIAFEALPALGADLDEGTFEGITTLQYGIHFAVVLLPGHGENMTWEQAKKWAAKQGGELPTRTISDMLFANSKDKLEPECHWTADEYSASHAWNFLFHDGYLFSDRKSQIGSAVAVLLIPITHKASK